MKKIIALSILLSALGAPAAMAQKQTQICDVDKFLECTGVCETKNLSPNGLAGCMVGCAIATGCDA